MPVTPVQSQGSAIPVLGAHSHATAFLGESPAPEIRG